MIQSRPQGFGSTMNKGYYMTFENGWSISVQWGPGNYCSRRSNILGASTMSMDEAWTSTDAEIAIIHKDGKWYSFGNDEVEGHQTPDEVASWITKVAAWPIENEAEIAQRATEKKLTAY